MREILLGAPTERPLLTREADISLSIRRRRVGIPRGDTHDPTLYPALRQTVARPGRRAVTAAMPASKSMPGSGLRASKRRVGALGAEGDGQAGAVLGGDDPGVRRGGGQVRAADDLDAGDGGQVDEAAVARAEIGDAGLVDDHDALGEGVGGEAEAAEGGAQEAEAGGGEEEAEDEEERLEAGVAAPDRAGAPAARRAAQPIGSRQWCRRAASSGRMKLIASLR